MSLAEAGVCNRALGRIGQTQYITDLTDKNQNGRACLLYFADSRDAVLEARSWPFAMRRAPLAPLTITRDGWLYTYAPPADLIAPRYIFNPALQAVPIISDPFAIDQVPGSPFPTDIPYAVEDDETLGKVILTNQQSAELVYTARITQVARWTLLFKDCVAWWLASDLALNLMKDRNLATSMMQGYERALARAAAASFNQQKPNPRPLSRYERSR